MASVDAGSINSSVRIDVDSLKSDAAKVEKVYDDLDASIRKQTQETGKAINNVAKAQKAGALTQEQALKRVIVIREKSLKQLKDNAAATGKASKKELAEINKLEQELKNLTRTQDKQTQSTKEGTAATNKQSNSFNKNAASVALVTAAVLTAKKAIDIFAKTEQSLANVRAVTNSTAEEFKGLEAAALAAGETTRFTAQQASEALFFLSSAGLDAAQSTAALGTTLLLAGATGSDLAFTAQTLTSTMSQYKIEAEDASRISNIFAAANSNSQATLEKLTGALRQTGAVAGLMNISLEETVGSLELLFNAGFQGEAAGRALKSALADLGNESSITITKLNDLGISFDDVNPSAVGLTNAIGVLEENNITAAQALDIFGKVAGPQLATLISAGKDEILKMTAAVTDTDEAARQYAVQNDTLAGSLDKLKSAGEGLAIAISDTLAPIIRTFADALTVIVNVVSKLPSVLLAAGTGAATAAVGVTVLSKALVIAGIALNAPLGIVAGVGALVVGLINIGISARKARVDELSKQFVELADSFGLTGVELENFTNAAVEAEIEIRALAASGAGIERIEGLVSNLTESLGLSKLEIIAIGLESDKVTDEYKAQLKILRDQLLEQELYLANLPTLTSYEKGIIEAKKAQARLDAQRSQTDAQKAKDDQDRIDRLEEIKRISTTLDEIANKSAVEESEILKQKISLRKEEIAILTDQALSSGVITDQFISDIAKQTAAIQVFEDRLAELTKIEKENEESLKPVYKARVKTYEQSLKSAEFAHRRFTEKVKKDDEDTTDSLIENWGNYSLEVLGFAAGLASALADLTTATADAEIAELNRVLDAKLDAIDVETAATLEALGLTEDTKIESLQKQLAAAIADGDTETAAELQDSLDREVILQDAEDSKAIITEASEKKIAEIRYKSEVAQWEAKKLSTIASGAAAVISSFQNGGGWPWGLIPAAAMTGIVTAQVLTIDKAKPVQAFEHGGIVLQQPGTSTTGDQQNVRANPREMFLTEQQQANLFKIANSGGNSGGSYHFYLDSMPISAKVVKDINNGKVRLNR